MKANTTTRTHVRCPNCGDDAHRIDHLFDRPASETRQFGPWLCDACGVEFSGTVDGRNVEITDVSKPLPPVAVVSRVKDCDGVDVYLIRFDREEPHDCCEDQDHGYRYLIDEHQCAGLAFQADIVLTRGDHDMHGIAEFVGVVRPGDGDLVETLRKIGVDMLAASEAEVRKAWAQKLERKSDGDST